MAKEKKKAQFFNCYLKQDLLDKIQAYSIETSLSKTAIVEKALEQFFANSESKEGEDEN